MQSRFEKNKWILSLLLIIIGCFLLGYLFYTPEVMYKDRGVIQSRVMESQTDPERRRYILLVRCVSGYNLKVYVSEIIYRRYKHGDDFSFHCPWKYARL